MRRALRGAQRLLGRLGPRPHSPATAPPPAQLPDAGLVLLIGASGSGKSTWARRHFLPTQVVSSDECRALVGDDAADQSVTREAFAVFHTILRQRLRLRRLTVADSTGLTAHARRRMLNMAAEHELPAHAVVFHAPLAQLRRNNARRARQVPDPILQRHADQLQALLASGELEREGYEAVHHVRAGGAN